MNATRTMKAALLVTLVLSVVTDVHAFTAARNSISHQSFARYLSAQSYEEQYNAAIEASEEEEAAVAPQSPTASLKKELLNLATATDRGFQATSDDRKRANGLINALALLNPTAEPAAPYYDTLTYIPGPSISGKWTLRYTDAPDITGLANTAPTAQLGRIGQECNPPYVKNVIEWKRPEWASNLPFSGTSDSRILQKVSTKATASPDDPLLLNLVLAGLELVTDDEDDDDYGMKQNGASFFDALQEKGLPVAFLQQAPLQLEGPLTAPFGKATILYLDEDLRILRTQQGYVAVNVRSDPVWF